MKELREVWLSYSGRGAYLQNNSFGDEKDGNDEGFSTIRLFF